MIIKAIIDLFFPPVCAGCNGFLLENEVIICTTCRHEMPQTNHLFVPKNELFNCLYGRVPLEIGLSLFYFTKNGIVQQLIHQLKYNGRQEIGVALANWFIEDLKKVLPENTINEIVPVPLHKKKFKERGYNQVNSFCEELSKNLNIPYNPNILSRNVYAKSQSKKNLFDRVVANNTIFSVTFTPKNHNKHFLLIDDVFTTGATIELCAKALLEIPNTKVSVLTIAMTH